MEDSVESLSGLFKEPEEFYWVMVASLLENEVSFTEWQKDLQKRFHS